MSRLSQTFLNDTARSLLGLAAVLVVACPLSVLLIFIPLYLNRQGQMSDQILVASLIAWLAVVVGGSLVAARVVAWSRKRRLDAVFTPLGLAGRPYAISGREYQGEAGGRAVTARFYRGPTLEITVQTGVQTRFGITEADQPGLFLAGQQVPLALEAPWLRNLRVYALDPAWTAGLLESPGTSGLVARLMESSAPWALIRQVILRPGRLTLTLYRSKNLFAYPFSTEEVRQWIADLAALAGLAESLPRPTLTAEESRVEQAERPGAIARNTLAFVLALFLLAGICVGLSFWLTAVVLK